MKESPFYVEKELRGTIDYMLPEAFKGKNPLKAIKQYHKALKYIERVQKKAISKKKGQKRSR